MKRVSYVAAPPNSPMRGHLRGTWRLQAVRGTRQNMDVITKLKGHVVCASIPGDLEFRLGAIFLTTPQRAF